MADEAASEEKAPEPKPAAPGLMASLIPALAVGLVLGGVGFALAYFVLPSRLQAAPVATVATANGTNAVATPAAPATDTSPASTGEKTQRTEAEKAATGNKEVTKFTIEEVTVNIADTRGNRFVRAGADFSADPAVLEELEANRARMIDTFEQVLSTKTLEQLTSPTVRGDLRTELLGIINPTLKAGRVDNIFFTDLLVQ